MLFIIDYLISLEDIINIVKKLRHLVMNNMEYFNQNKYFQFIVSVKFLVRSSIVLLFFVIITNYVSLRYQKCFGPAGVLSTFYLYL